MKQKLHSLLLMVALLSWSMVVAASDFDDGILKYTITSPSNLEVRCDGFTNAHTNDESVVIPETVNYNNRTYTVTMIGDGDSTYSNGSCSFSSKLKSILLPNSIVTINNYCFSKCYSLTEINIPNSVTAIGDVAFQYCGLTSLVIPESIKKIGNGAFYGNSHLMEVFFLGCEKPKIRSNAFDYCHSALTLYVPNKETYGNASNMVQYVSFPTSTYAYTGMAPKLEWQNNLKGYTATLEDASALDKSVGSHSANVKVRYSNGVDITVEIPYEYTITPAPLSLTVNNATREYGNPNPEFSSVITGFVDGENADNQNMTVNYTCAADRQSNAGNYRILASVNAPNYEVTYHYGTLVVTKAPLTLKVKNTSRLYGDENPQFELIYTGLRNNETSPTWTQAIKVATTATKKSHCGVYPITISGGVSQNYTVSEYTNGELTVSKRPLTVRALDYERSYGEANPTFKIAYDGFVNSDNESCISPKPALSCEATKESNAGTYQILVTGGKAEDYAITYQYGKLIIKPLYLGFKETYNTVTYNEKGKSVSDLAFEYIPALNMDYDLSDLKLEIWALDGENKYPQHVWTVAGGSYAGNYVNYSGATYAGKYIMTIAGFKTANPNLQVDQKTARAYLTVEKASNELQWADEEPITVAVGETKELGISYGADLYCKFNLVFDESLIQVRAADKETNQSKWYIVGLKEGTTDLSFNISCMKNDWGFYNFDASQTLTRRIQIVPATDINKTTVSSEVQEVARYSLNGQRLTAPTKGVNIVKYSDGSVRKEIVK
uniref:MBG domain-containing protein n=1 Tax=Prevotella sp. TaxID=59823 RepID=UPI004028739B